MRLTMQGKAGMLAGALAALGAGLGQAPDPGQLPPPVRRGTMTLEDVLARRRSIRSFAGDTLSRAELGQLCWATQGVTAGFGGRTAPSAGGLYPLELYVVTPGGAFQYEPRRHRLDRRIEGDLRGDLRRAALDQDAVGQAAAVFVIAAVVGRTAAKYGPGRARRYVHLEAGHAAQNLLLQAVALGLGAVPVGAFHDDAVSTLLRLPADHEPLYLIPVGWPGR